MAIKNNKFNSCYIGLGSNLESPIKQINKALTALNELPKSQLIVHSSLYLSKPMGPKDQNDFINAVANLSTQLAPIELLDCLQQIELEQGRELCEENWGPRTLDLDILLYANQVINHPRLRIPHYGMKEREFVLIPLNEIAPELKLPDNSRVSLYANQINTNGIKRL